MSYLLNIALQFYQGKMDAETFMMRYIRERHGKFTNMYDNYNVSKAECDIFSACDVFLPSLGLHGVAGEHDINETQFRQEVEQALKSVGMI